MTLTYQRFTAVLLIYDSLFLSDIFYCLRVLWCAAARMSEHELEQKTGNETREKLVPVYGDNGILLKITTQ
jgi:hypothetical protein